MKKLISFLLLAALLITSATCLMPISADEPQYEETIYDYMDFGTQAKSEWGRSINRIYGGGDVQMGMQGSNVASFVMNDDSVTLTAKDAGALKLSAKYMNIFSDQVSAMVRGSVRKWVKIVMKNNSSSTSLALSFFNSPNTSNSSAANNKTVTISANDTEFKTYYIDLTACSGWNDSVYAFNFVVNSVAAEATVEIDYIVFGQNQEQLSHYYSNREEKAQLNASDNTQFTLSFDANGGAGVMNGGTYAASKVVTLPACTFTAPVGKQFNGWNTKPDGTGRRIQYREKAGTDSKTEGGYIYIGQEIVMTTDITLYAQWTDSVDLVNGYWYQAPRYGKWVSYDINTNEIVTSNKLLENRATIMYWLTFTCSTCHNWMQNYMKVILEELRADGGDILVVVFYYAMFHEPVAVAQSRFWQAGQFSRTGNYTWVAADQDHLQKYARGGVPHIELYNRGAEYAYAYGGTGGLHNQELNNWISLKLNGSDTEDGLFDLVEETVTLTYHSNYDSDSTSVSTIAKDSVEILGVKFSREGYVLTGWNEKADGTGKAYGINAAIRPSENTAVYAQWAEIGETPIETTTVNDETTTAAPEETTTAAPEETTTAAPEETTTAAPEETTTAAPEETTTAAPEETTTAAPDETTAANDETTAANDETTAAPAETTAAPAETTTEAPAPDTTSTSTENKSEEKGGFPTWAIAVIVVGVVGVGVGAFFIFKKK